MITKFGKRFLTSYLAGHVDFTRRDLAFGIGSTAPNAKGNDTRLEFEFYRIPATLGSIDIAQTGVDGDGDPIFSYNVIYKATLPQDVAGVISEIGLYPGERKSINNFDSKFITSFENNVTWTNGIDNPGIKMNDLDEPFISKIGESMIQISTGPSSSKEYTNSLVSLDLSGYSVNDSLSIAYKKVDNNISKIRVKLYSSSNAYFYADFTPASGSGDRIQSVPMATVFGNTSVGYDPDPKSIIKVGVEITASSGGATTVYFDGLRINDEDTFDPLYGLISRSVLTTPLEKASGRPVDIEYKLQLEF